MQSFTAKFGLISLALLVAAGCSNDAATSTKEETMTSSAITLSVHHIGLTVTDLEATTAFFTDGLGWRLSGRDPSYPASFVRGGGVTLSLWRAEQPAKAVRFDRKKNVGLHHLAFELGDIETLDALHDRLAEYPGVKIEFPPEPNSGGPTIHMIVYEPSGNRIEFTVPGGRSAKDAE